MRTAICLLFTVHALMPALAEQTSIDSAPAKATAQYCTTLMNLGELDRLQQHPEQAEKHFQEAIGIARGLQSARPDLYAEALSRLGGLYGQSDRPERARPLLTEAIDRLSDLTPPATGQLAYARNALGMIELEADHLAAGELQLREAASLASTALGEDNPETAAYQTNLALALILEGRFARADALLRRARFVVEARSGPSDGRLGVIFGELSAAAEGSNKLAMAENYAMSGIAVMKGQTAPDTAAIAVAQVNLASLYLRQRKTGEAERILPEAVETERRVITNGRTLADGIRRLAELRAAQHAWDESEALYREAIGLYTNRLGPGNPQIKPVRRAYADVLRHARRHA